MDYTYYLDQINKYWWVGLIIVGLWTIIGIIGAYYAKWKWLITFGIIFGITVGLSLALSLTLKDKAVDFIIKISGKTTSDFTEAQLILMRSGAKVATPYVITFLVVLSMTFVQMIAFFSVIRSQSRKNRMNKMLVAQQKAVSLAHGAEFKRPRKHVLIRLFGGGIGGALAFLNATAFIAPLAIVAKPNTPSEKVGQLSLYTGLKVTSGFTAKVLQPGTIYSSLEVLENLQKDSSKLLKDVNETKEVIQKVFEKNSNIALEMPHATQEEVKAKAKDDASVIAKTFNNLVPSGSNAFLTRNTVEDYIKAEANSSDEQQKENFQNLTNSIASFINNYDPSQFKSTYDPEHPWTSYPSEVVKQTYAELKNYNKQTIDNVIGGLSDYLVKSGKTTDSNKTLETIYKNFLNQN